MECLIYKWDIIKIKDRYLVYGFGHDIDNNSIAIKIDDFHSYVYIEKNKIYNYKNLIKNNNTKISLCKKRKLRNYDLGYQEFIKIESNNSKIIDIIEKSNNIENNINLYIKFLIYCKIQGTGWLKINNPVLIEKNDDVSVDYQYSAKCENIKDFKKEIITSPLILAIDIECYSTNINSLPDSNNPDDVIFMISFVTKNNKYLLYLWDNEENLESHDIIFKKYNNENDLIKGYFQMINEINPDVIIGYNILNFDFKYISERFGNSIPNTSKLMNIGKTIKRNMKWSSSAFGINEFVIFDTEGRCVVDIYQFIKRNYKLDQYSLNFVSNYFIHKNKKELPIKDLFCYYKKNDKKSIKKIAEYCLEDSVLLIEIFDKLSIWITLIQLSNISCTPIQDITIRGQEYIVKPTFYKLCNKYNILIDNVNNSYNNYNYKGATVLEPVTGLYKWPFVLDFTSLYPSIIIAKNICYTTFYTNNDKDSLDYLTINDDGKKYSFLKKEKRIGIIPQLLNDFLTERNNIKLKLKRDKLTNLEKLILDKQQWCFKILANSVYGLLGSRNSKDMGFLPGAISTTSWGRKYLEDTKIIIENIKGCKVIYGDTDSFIIINTNIQNIKECKRLSDQVIDTIYNNNKDINIKLETIFTNLYLLSKKMYAGITENDKIVYKGVINVRRNYPKYVRNIYSNTLDMILKDDNKDDIFNFVRKEIKKLINNKVDLEDLIVLKTINENYKNDVYEIKLFLERYIKEYKYIKKGSRLECLYIKNNMKYVGHKIYTVDEVKEKKMEIDNMYYFERYMKNIDNLLKIFGKNNFSKTVLNEKEGNILNYFKKLEIKN